MFQLGQIRGFTESFVGAEKMASCRRNNSRFLFEKRLMFVFNCLGRSKARLSDLS